MSTEMIIDFTEVQNMFRSTPEIFLTEMRKFLYRERRSFVGNRQKPGSFRKSLYGQMHHYYGRPWKPYVADAFTGTVSADSSGMTLIMGVKQNRLEKMPYLKALAEGATITPKNAKYLLIPHYENLRAVGLFGRLGGSGKNTYANQFRKWADAGYIDGPVPDAGGKLLFFGDFGNQKGSHYGRHLMTLNRKLLFTGVKRVQIKKRFDFVGKFKSRQSGMLNRANTAVKRAILAVERNRAGT
jgi:hypothetical protein